MLSVSQVPQVSQVLQVSRFHEIASSHDWTDWTESINQNETTPQRNCSVPKSEPKPSPKLESLKFIPDLKLHTFWTYGQITGDYTIIPFCPIPDVRTLWSVLHQTFLIKEFKMDSSGINEIYYFRKKIPPHWKEAKVPINSTIITELIIRFDKNPDLSREIILRLLLSMVGESLVHEDISEDIFGIRIKPSKFGGDTRFWIRGRNSVNDVRIAIEKLINEYLRFEVKTQVQKFHVINTKIY